DNLSWVRGNHDIKLGGLVSNMRYPIIQPPAGHGSYTYNGQFTSAETDNINGGVSGFGVADFLADFQSAARLTNFSETAYYRWDYGAFLEDNWKATPKLTLNLGLRWEVQTPVGEASNHQGSFAVDYSSMHCAPDPNFPGICDASMKATYYLPKSTPASSLSPQFLAYLNDFPTPITVQNTSNNYLTSYPKDDFAPRIGVAYQPFNHWVVRGGFGVFYGAIEQIGYGSTPAQNYPFTASANFYAPPCLYGATNCTQTDGVTLKSGFPSSDLGNGFLAAAAAQNPGLYGIQPRQQTPYVMQTNFTVERSLMRNMTASIGYVGSMSRHVLDALAPGAYLAAMDGNVWSQACLPNGTCPNANVASAFSPVESGVSIGNMFSGYQSFGGLANYNSLQATINRRFSNGLSFFANYTFSRFLTDITAPGGEEGSQGYGGVSNSPNIEPLRKDYGPATYDIPHRVNFFGTYELPFGKGHRWLNKGGVWNELAGGWSSTLVFQAQSGDALTVFPNFTVAQGLSTYAKKIGNPNRAGSEPTLAVPTATGLTAGNQNPGQQGITSCPTKLRITAPAVGQAKYINNWYNPCAFENPPQYFSANGTLPPLTSWSAVTPYWGGAPGQLRGPGFNVVNMSLFKGFAVGRREGEVLTFRADSFNVLNHPSFADPSTGVWNGAGEITSTRTIEQYTTNARSFQLSMKYTF
ncbi:MAG: TonB-dependent receptor, partial [Silvibacterium sp.]